MHACTNNFRIRSFEIASRAVISSQKITSMKMQDQHSLVPMSVLLLSSSGTIHRINLLSKSVDTHQQYNIRFQNIWNYPNPKQDFHTVGDPRVKVIGGLLRIMIKGTCQDVQTLQQLELGLVLACSACKNCISIALKQYLQIRIRSAVVEWFVWMK